jgi:hypothetical protein
VSVKTLTIEHPIKVNDKPLYGKIKRIMTGTYRVEFYYGKEKLAEGTVHASSFTELINAVRNELNKFLKEIVEKR